MVVLSGTPPSPRSSPSSLSRRPRPRGHAGRPRDRDGGKNTLDMSAIEVKLLLRGKDEKPVGNPRAAEATTPQPDRAARQALPAAFTFTRAAAAGPAAAPSLRSRLGGRPRARRGPRPPGREGRPRPRLEGLPGWPDRRGRESRQPVRQDRQRGIVRRPRRRKGDGLLPQGSRAPGHPARRLDRRRNDRAGGARRGVLQEVRKAKVVGFETPGTGGTDDAFPLKDDTAVLLTSGIFTLPSGRKLWDDGLSPDAAIPSTSSTTRPISRKPYLFCPSSDG